MRRLFDALISIVVAVILSVWILTILHCVFDNLPPITA